MAVALRRLLTGLVLCGAVKAADLGRDGEAEAHTLVGRIVSAANGEPIGYAALELRNAEGRLLRRTAADAQGAFAIERVGAGDYLLGFGPVGAEPERTPPFHVASGPRPQDLGLLRFNGLVVRLQQVEVSARKEAFANSIDRKTYNVGTDVRSVGGSVSDVLQSIPSVQVDVDGNVSLRGDSSVLILIDGKPSTQMSAVNRPDVLAQMPADNLERVEVITNPSAKFKPDGTAGIINLVTKRRQPDGLAGTWRTSVGNDGRANLGLSLSGSRGALGLQLNVGARQDDRVRLVSDHRSHPDAAGGAWVETNLASREHMRPLSRLALLGLDYRWSKADKLSLSASYNLRTFFRDSVLVSQTGPQAGAPTSDYDRLRADQEWQKTFEIKSSYTHAFAGDGHELAVDFKRDRHQELENNVYTNSYRVPVRGPSRDATVINPTESGSELTVDYTRPMAGGAKLEAGWALDANQNDMDYRGAVADAGGTGWSNDVTRTNRFLYRDLIDALYATWSRPFGEFGLLAGLRVEESVVDTNQITAGLRDRTEFWRLHPSLHATYQATETGQWQLNYSHRVHRPETEDLNPFPQYQDPFNLRAGNPRLRPEETHSVEAGYQYRRDERTYLATVYLRDTYHAFTTVTRYVTPVTLLTTHENLARNHSGGLELVANTNLGAAVTMNASVNVFRGEVDASNLGFTTARSVTSASAKLNLNWRAGKRDVVQVDASQSAKRLTAQGYRLPVGVANLGWRHEFAARGHVLTLTVSDVFDSLRERTVIDTASLREEMTRRRNSRIVYLGYSYTFGKSAKKGKKDDLQFDNSL